MKTLAQLLNEITPSIKGANTGGRGHNVELKRPEPLKLKDKKQKPFKKRKKKKESENFEKEPPTQDQWKEYGGMNEPF